MIEHKTTASAEAVAAGMAPLPERSPEWALKLAFMDALFREDGQMIGYADRMVEAVKRLGWRPPA